LFFDWHQFHRDETPSPAVVDPRRRVPICLAVFAALLAIIFFRAVQLETTYGAAYRAEALKPVEKERTVSGKRGKITARDGTALACDREVPSLAMSYRYLQNPPDPKWLRTAVRARLSKSERAKHARVAEEEKRVLAEREATAHQLARLCSLSDDEWSARAAQIQSRVAKIAAAANARQEQKIAEADEDEDETYFQSLLRLLKGPQPPTKVVVVEELDYHAMCDDPPTDAVAEIESHPEKYLGAKIVKRMRRSYPNGKLAGNVLGYLGLASEETESEDVKGGYRSGDWVGKLGIEKGCETTLRGRSGTAIDTTDHTGHVLSTSFRKTPENGGDVALTLDFALQQSAEALLDSAIERRRVLHPESKEAGGAIIVMEIVNGSLRAVAAAPRFDPNLFMSDRSEEIEALLSDPSRPLFDRASRMAIAPGSVFKIVTAAALLEAGGVDPDAPFFCRGYLNRPDERRCAIFVRDGIGHGETTLADALAMSCNVYFFHHAGKMGPEPLVDWAARLGFGHPTGADLPGEAAGVVPNPEMIESLEHHAWTVADTQAMAVGQGSLTVTPLQVACLMAAVAGDGSFVPPHVLRRTGFQPVTEASRAPDRLETCPTRITGLREKTLKSIREGLERAVSDPAGTAHETVYLKDVPIAGKTGTAETGDDASHAWFAGYVPADKPRYVFVIALERAGEAAATAGPVARRIVLRMKELGMLEP
jgi:penicillin-binding protein 2